MHRAIWQQCEFLGFIAEQAERNAIAYAGRSEHATPHIDEHDIDFGCCSANCRAPSTPVKMSEVE